jgi:hypothetical protein
VQAIDKIDKSAAGIYMVNQLGATIGCIPAIAVAAARQVRKSFEKGGADLLLICIGRFHFFPFVSNAPALAGAV